jgi:hypothetical protein
MKYLEPSVHKDLLEAQAKQAHERETMRKKLRQEDKERLDAKKLKKTADAADAAEKKKKKDAADKIERLKLQLDKKWDAAKFGQGLAHDAPKKDVIAI